MKYNNHLTFWDYFERTCAVFAAVATIGFVVVLFFAPFWVAGKNARPDKDRIEYLERRVSALELAADSLQRQIDFVCE